MGEIKEPYPVKLICPTMARKEEWIAEAKCLLESEFGPCDLESEIWSFDSTDYYEDEMGTGLLKSIFIFQELILPDSIVEKKHTTNAVEKQFADEHEADVVRPINLDPGYVAESKMVLATTKDYTHRIYLRDGIYAEATLRWTGGEYRSWPWTYPDYQTEEYREFLAEVRRVYREQLKAWKRAKSQNIS